MRGGNGMVWFGLGCLFIDAAAGFRLTGKKYYLSYC
jgi:hypothetical protein